MQLIHSCRTQSTPSGSSHSQDDLVVDLDCVEGSGLVVLAVSAQLVLDDHTAPVHVANNVLTVLQGCTAVGWTMEWTMRRA